MLTARLIEAAHRINLAVLPTHDVRPHEIADPGREERIEQRLRDDGMLRDPVIVGAVPDFEGYVLLDGTNRKRALANLGYRLILAQVLDYADTSAVELRSWCHAAGVSVADLLSGLRSVAGLEAEPLPPLGAGDALSEHATLAVLLDRSERVALVRTDSRVGRAEQLRSLVDLYEPTLTRVDCDAQEAEETAKRLSRTGTSSTLIAFPPFSRSQVVAMAMARTPIPAGITRHILHGGRALRVNLPLTLLETDNVDVAHEALIEHLDHLHPRMYREPTLLFDS